MNAHAIWVNPFAGPLSYVIVFAVFAAIYLLAAWVGKRKGTTQQLSPARKVLAIAVSMAFLIGALGLWEARWEDDDSPAAGPSAIQVLPVIHSASENADKCADSCPTAKQRVKGHGAGKKYGTAKGIKLRPGIQKKISKAMAKKGYGARFGDDPWWKRTLTTANCFTGVVQASLCMAGQKAKAVHVTKVWVRCGGEAVILGLTGAGVGAVGGGAPGGAVGAAIGLGGGHTLCMYNSWMDHLGWK